MTAAGDHPQQECRAVHLTIDMFFGDEPKLRSGPRVEAAHGRRVSRAAYGVRREHGQGHLVGRPDPSGARSRCCAGRRAATRTAPTCSAPTCTPPCPRRADSPGADVDEVRHPAHLGLQRERRPAPAGAGARGARRDRRAARLRPDGVRSALPRRGAALLPAGPVADPHGPRSRRRCGPRPASSCCRWSTRSTSPSRWRLWTCSPTAGRSSGSASATAPTSSTRSGWSRAPGWPASRSRWRWSARCGAATTVDFDGRFFSVHGARPAVVPLQPGGPPVWIGGQAAGAVKRAARMGDAWYAPPFPTHAELGEPAPAVPRHPGGRRAAHRR